MDIKNTDKGLTKIDEFSKRLFDLILSVIALSLTWWLILLAFLLAAIDTRQNGFFTQVRIGRHGKRFKVLKIRTMRSDPAFDTNVTTQDDSRITRLGAFFRRSKIDELPQFINVFLGSMSFVGPRPDVPGFADQLEGEDQVLLTLRPGITGPASLKYRDEEVLLADKTDPEKYNSEVIWPDKVKINRQYMEDWSLWLDVKYLLHTVTGFTLSDQLQDNE